MPEIAETKRSHRILSLDVVRGITIAFMILVNNNGSRFAFRQLEHSPWSGWTLTDLVFPSFLFMVGITIVFSNDARLARNEPRSRLFLHVFQRAAILFCFGLIVNGFPHFNLHTLRIYGVLQRIALCYLIVSAIYLFTRRAWVFVSLIVVALIGYYLVMRWVPVPGFGMPVRDIPLLDMDRNWVAYIDRGIFPNRLYQKVRDPEGLLSSLPALATTAFGVLTGLWLRSRRTGLQKVYGMLAASIAGIVTGEVWNLWFPINKKLWTSSYVLFAAGCTLMLLSVCYYILDVRELRRYWTWPWLVFGSNAITAYMVSELLAGLISAIHVTCHGEAMSLHRCIYGSIFQDRVSPPIDSLLYSLAFVAVCFVPNAILYRRRIFLKI